MIVDGDAKELETRCCLQSDWGDKTYARNSQKITQSETWDSPRVALNADYILKIQVKKKQTQRGLSLPIVQQVLPIYLQAPLAPGCLLQMNQNIWPWAQVPRYTEYRGAPALGPLWDKAHLEPFTSSYLFKAILDCIRNLFRKTSCSLWWLSRVTNYFTGF